MAQPDYSGILWFYGIGIVAAISVIALLVYIFSHIRFVF
jgi:hypothetical protein